MTESFLATKYVGFATHTAPNHPDELLAYAMLVGAGILDPGAPVVHTRDQELLEDLFSQGYFIADVGGKNIPGWMDHHQDRNLPAASTLVWQAIHGEEALPQMLQIVSDRDCSPGEGLKKWPPHVADLGEIILLFNGEESAWKIQTRLAALALKALPEMHEFADVADFPKSFEFSVPEFLVAEMEKGSPLPTYLPTIGKYLPEAEQEELREILASAFALLVKRKAEAEEVLANLEPLGNGAFLSEKEINLSQAIGWGLSVPEGMKFLVMPGEDQPGTFKVSATRGNSVPEEWAGDERVIFCHPAGFFARVKTLALFEGN